MSPWARVLSTHRGPLAHDASFDPERVKDALSLALLACGLECKGHFEHRYRPFGVSLGRSGVNFMVVVHTWPEHGLATVDGRFLDQGVAQNWSTAVERAFGWVGVEQLLL